MRKKTQKERIVKRLIEIGYITTPYAIANMVTTKLSTRLGELEREFGVEFKRSRIAWGDTYGTRYDIDDEQIKYLAACVVSDSLGGE